MIKFQYNKTSLGELGKQLKIRTRALPTLKNKEAALRLEVKKAKRRSDELLEELSAALERYSYLSGLSSSLGSSRCGTWSWSRPSSRV